LYLTASDVIEINASILGPDRLRDYGLLDSAVFRPQQTVGGDDAWLSIEEKAAVLFEAIIRNHAFLDGNKRTAVIAMVTFLSVNGYELWMDDGEIVDLAVLTAEGLRSADEIAARLKGRVDRPAGDSGGDVYIPIEPT
jgi:death-on-curing protein